MTASYSNIYLHKTTVCIVTKYTQSTHSTHEQNPQHNTCFWSLQ